MTRPASPDDVVCPRCRALPGLPCRVPGGQPLSCQGRRRHHVAREVAAIVEADGTQAAGIVSTQEVRGKHRRVTVSVPASWPEVGQWTYRANRHGGDYEIILSAVRGRA